MIEFQDDTLICQKAGLVFAEVDGYVVMLNEGMSQYFKLNLVGSSIWGLLQEPIRVSAIVEDLVRRYRVDEERCRSKTIEFLQSLDEKSFIQLQ